MLKKLTVKNFQKHKTYELGLDHPITIITGPSGRGKSSLVRAIKWICLNQPTGISFATRGQDKDCEATLEFDEYTVTRKRGKNNEYWLGDQEYRAFGAGKVPADISKVLNVDALNFSHQLDFPFWFDLSPGQVSKELNSIIQLDVIDSSLSKSGSAVRESNSEVKICKERLKIAKQKKKDLLWVKAINTELLELEVQNKELVQLQTKASTITELLNGGTKALLRLETLSTASVEAATALLKFPLKLIERVKKAEDILNELNHFKKKLDEAKKAEDEAQQKIDDNKGISCPTCGQEIDEEHLLECTRE